jgi:hypothetical protein
MVGSVATTETAPCAPRKARSLSFASRWTSEKARSPPRITPPARERPSARLCATEPTPAIAMTPSAMQATKTPKPRNPPRNSRQAKRSATGVILAAPSAADGCSIRPECMCSTRSQRAASAVSWVTSTSVVPCSRWPRNRSSMISRPVASSRLPVGSSATTIAGRGAARGQARRAAARRRTVRRIVTEPLAKPDRGQLPLGARKCIARAGEFERHGDVFQRRHGRDQVEGLEYDADSAAAKARQRVLVELAQVLAGNHDRTGCRAAPARSSP